MVRTSSIITRLIAYLALPGRRFFQTCTTDRSGAERRNAMRRRNSPLTSSLNHSSFLDKLYIVGFNNSQCRCENLFFCSWLFFSSPTFLGVPCLLCWAFLTTKLHVSWRRRFRHHMKLKKIIYSNNHQVSSPGHVRSINHKWSLASYYFIAR